MHIAIGSDHAGFRLKEQLKEHLLATGHTVEDKGTFSDDSTDYPDYAHAVARDVAEKKVDLGIVICGCRIRVNITANNNPGVRSGLAWTVEVAEVTGQHNASHVVACPPTDT